MADIGLVQQVSGEWNRSGNLVRLRMAADKLDQPQDMLIAPQEVQLLINLLLVLSGKAGPDSGPASEDGLVRPVAVDRMALGATDDGDTVLELTVG